MAIITVQGASAGAFINVTVDGAATDALGQLVTSFSNSLTSQIGSLNAEELAGSGTYNFSGNATGYAVITAAGSYSVTGDVGYLSFGGPNGTTPSGSVQVNASHVTAGTMSVEGGTTGGIQFQAGTSNGTFVAGAGNNTFVGDQLVGGGDWNITTATGNDTIIAGTGHNTINAGTGDNLILLNNGISTVTSYGNDTILSACNPNQTVSIFGGSSFVSLGSSALVSDSAGYNSITVGGASTVAAGTHDAISLTGAAASSVYGGVSDTISATGNAFVTDADSASVNASGALTFVGGTGQTTITASATTIFGGAGLDATVDVTGTSYGLFVANGGNETLNGASSHTGIQAFGNVAGYSGTQTFIGGTASDTLVAGVGDATLQGGSGAANMFAFRDGIAGANYTITDFGSAAGNYVVLLGYSDSSLANSLANQTHSGSNTSITLSDGSTITFDNVASLDASQFKIWSS